MSTDTSKILLKEQLEERNRCLDNYRSRDVADLPGWSFLLTEVIKAYGVCPHLDVVDSDSRERRLSWLSSQSDKGLTYYEQVKPHMDHEWIVALEREIESIRSAIYVHVVAVLTQLNNETTATTRGAENDDESDLIVDHDKLLEYIRLKKDSKSQNQQTKNRWKRTVNSLNHLIRKKGLDFSKYAKTIYGYKVKYKRPHTTALDATFESLNDRCSDLQTQLDDTKLKLDKEKEDAEIHLTELIKGNFQSDQMGRYYKKWSSLTQDKKEDRIMSYCVWFVKQHHKPMSLSEHMKKFIIDKLTNKELKVTDIKWNSKSGIISHVNIVLQDDDTFALNPRPPRILKSSRKSRKNHLEDHFKSESQRPIVQRMHRLLLFELIKGQTLNKDLIVQSVLKNLHSRTMPDHNHISDYISAKYDVMLDTIRNNLHLN
jgi:hypothetical protein